MTTAITKADPELIKKARLMSGTNLPQNKLNYIKIMYDAESSSYGNFILKTWDSNLEAYNDVDLGKEFKGVVLVCSKKCSQWEDGKNIWESNEFFNYDEVLTLTNTENDSVKKGTYRELKNENELLKLQLALYVLVNEKVYCVFIKGGTIIDFGNYDKTIKDSGGTIQQYETLFTMSKEKNGAVTFFKIHFEIAEEVDLVKTYAMSMQVRNAINARRGRSETKKDEELSPPATEVVDVSLDDLPF